MSAARFARTKGNKMRTLWVIMTIVAFCLYSWMWYDGVVVEAWTVIPWVVISMTYALEDLFSVDEENDVD